MRIYALHAIAEAAGIGFPPIFPITCARSDRLLLAPIPAELPALAALVALVALVTRTTAIQLSCRIAVYQTRQARITLAERSKTCYYLPYATNTNDNYSYR